MCEQHSLINLPPHHRDQQLPPAPKPPLIPEDTTCRDKQKRLSNESLNGFTDHSKPRLLVHLNRQKSAQRNEK